MSKIKAAFILFLLMIALSELAMARSERKERERDHWARDRVLYTIGNVKKPPKNDAERAAMREWMRDQCRIHQGPFFKLQVDWKAMRFWCIVGE